MNSCIKIDLRDKWLTIDLSMIFISLYLCTRVFDIKGFIGLLIINIILFNIFESLFYKITKIKFSNLVGLVLFGISLIYCLLIIYDYAFFSSIRQMSIYAGIILLIVMFYFIKIAKQYINKVFIILFFGSILMSILYILLHLTEYSPDSYSYFDISKTFFNHFGEINVIRQYVIKTKYNISFPYFYPFLIFIFNKITSLDRFSSIVINFYSYIFSILFLIKISKKHTNKYWCGLIVASILSTCQSYLQEIAAGRAIPVYILLSLISIDLFFLENKNHFFFFGLTIGLMMCTRFDGIMALTFVAIYMFFHKKTYKELILFFVGVILVCLPWMIYSFINFNKIWISDNSKTYFLVNPDIPVRIIFEGDGTKTLFNSPSEWFESIIPKIRNILLSLIKCSFLADILVALLLFWYVIRGKKTNKINIILPFLYCACKTGMYSLVGYGDIRYHVETIIVFSLALAIECEKNEIIIKSFYSNIIALILSCFCIYLFYEPIEYSLFSKINHFLEINECPYWITALNNELQINGIEMDSKIFFYMCDGYSFGSYTNRKIFADIRNKDIPHLEYALENLIDADYMIVPYNQKNDKTVIYMLNNYSSKKIGDYLLFTLGEQQ